MKFPTIHLSFEELNDHSDTVKVLVVGALVQEGFLDREEAEHWCERHTVIVERRRWWQTLLKKADPGSADGEVILRVVTSTIAPKVEVA